MVNRLADSTSPYLQQHADNPVDWFEWGDEAFEEARRRDVPIFLSIGYSSCHWCHVMAHESFEDDEVAAYLNEHFVPVKVDREERPDVDAVYMEATTALTGHGGWPMSVFLDHERRPFFAGTYWPKEDRMGMPGFQRVLESVSDAWGSRRDEVVSAAERITDALSSRVTGSPGGEADPTVADRAEPLALQAWDRRLGGFGRAPKFPQAMTLDWLLERHLRLRGDGTDGEGLTAVLDSLEHMARGGIHDQVGGGFHRYSTDAQWLVPHFEKMLYDNALLAPVYARAAALTGDARFDRVARSTLDYLLREMRHASGGFFSATDADSEGEEGRFFVWDHDELAEVAASVGVEPDIVAEFHGVRPGGNWAEEHGGRQPTGTNILHEPEERRRFCERHGFDLDEFTRALDLVHEELYERREQRVHPDLDDKVLTSWNALTVRALALTGMHLGLPEYVEQAVATGEFLHDELVVDGQLHHVWKDGRVAVGAFLEDVAYLAIACLELFAATGDVVWFERAQRWAGDARDRFRDEAGGGYFSTAHDAEELYRRPKDTWDNATPSGNSVMAEVALRLAAYTGEDEWREEVERIIATFQEDAARAPTGYGWLLRVCEQALSGPREVAVVGRPGDAREALVRELWQPPRAGLVVAVAEPDSRATGQVPLLRDRSELDGRAAAYVCRGFVCERPVSDPGALRELLAAS